MNSSERVIPTTNNEEPDKTPTDLASTTVSSINYMAYKNLLQYMNGEPDYHPRISHIHQGTICPRENLLKRFKIDFQPVFMKKSPRPFAAKRISDDSFYDEYNILWKKSGNYGYTPIKFPLADSVIEDLDKVTWPGPYDPERVEGLRKEIRNFMKIQITPL